MAKNACTLCHKSARETTAMLAFPDDIRICDACVTQMVESVARDHQGWRRRMFGALALMEPIPVKPPDDNIECSFCGTSATPEDAKGRFVAGPNVFICRGCVDMTIDIFGERDPQWAAQKIEALETLRSAK